MYIIECRFFLRNHCKRKRCELFIYVRLSRHLDENTNMSAIADQRYSL